LPACGSRICSTTISAAPKRCIIPYATQEGEISFCAYNTGIGWRNIIEKMHMTATLTKWYEEHGRHQIYAGGKNVELSSTEHNLVLDPEAVAAGKQTDLDELGVAKNAREEKLRARKQQQEHERMAALYRQHVLKEAAPEPTVQISGLGGKKKPEPQVLHKNQSRLRAQGFRHQDGRAESCGRFSFAAGSPKPEPEVISV
jgi:hypothetical protein